MAQGTERRGRLQRRALRGFALDNGCVCACTFFDWDGKRSGWKWGWGAGASMAGEWGGIVRGEEMRAYGP